MQPKLPYPINDDGEFARTEFRHDLPARAARHSMGVRTSARSVGARNEDRLNSSAACRHSLKNCDPFCANGKAEGGVFDVAPGKNASLCQDGSTDPKVRVRAVSTICSGACGFQQFFLHSSG